MNIETKRKQLLKYTYGMILPSAELMQLSATDKLTICQITPEKVIKKWPQGAYVPVWYIERCLNFVSNFNWWCKVQREGIKQVKRKVKDKKTGGRKDVDAYDAWVLADFYIELDWRKIDRSCYGSWIMYDNPATSSFNALEAARSIATKSFADTLGIASDKLSKEFDSQRQDLESSIIDGDKPDTDGKHKEKLAAHLRSLGYTTAKQVDMRLQKNFPSYDAHRSLISEIDAQKIYLAALAKQ